MKKQMTNRATGKELLAFSLTVAVVMSFLFAVGQAAINQDQHTAPTTSTAVNQQPPTSRVPAGSVPGLDWRNRIRIKSTPCSFIIDPDRGRAQEALISHDNDDEFHFLGSIRAPLLSGNLTVAVTYETTSGLLGLEDAGVISTSQPLGQAQLSGLTHSDGNVTFTNLLPGQYDIEVYKSGFENQSRIVWVVASQDVFVSVSLRVSGAPDYGGSGSPSGGVPTASLLIVGFVIMFISVMVVVANRVKGSESGSVHTDASVQPEVEEIETSQEEAAEDHENVEDYGHARPRSSLSTCPYCEVNLTRVDASFCWNCGGNLSAPSESVVARGGRKNAAMSLGKCMVCNLEVETDDTALWCPHCGNIAHRIHMLEWLHVKDYCPTCHKHLEEGDLMDKPTKRRSN